MVKMDLKAQMQQYLSCHHVPPITLLYLAQAKVKKTKIMHQKLKC